jgi:7,8-dihydropterin-6-yl-methyl-4-(beta-D-ribofuranosyl)aminobenzene 5'-phosphate synthase
MLKTSTTAGLTGTVLIENSSGSARLTAQHGFSCYIETAGRKILLDAGQDDAFSRNAAVLGKKLDAVDFAVVSHPHYDHAGGIQAFCALNKTAPVYTFWNKKDEYFSTTHSARGQAARPIGFPLKEKDRDRIVSLGKHEITELAANVWFLPATVHSHHTPFKDKTLFIKRDGQPGISSDTFDDEGILVIEIERNGAPELILFNSCSHNGVVNSIESVKKALPEKNITAYIGGFHFPWADGEQIAAEDIEAMNELAAYAVQEKIILYSGHCTGPAAQEYLAGKLGGQFHRLTTGSSFQFPAAARP